ncbi:hypothetical protein PROFUN_00952 [Planoprotostelium fungivorum]|uniref:Transmembrane protein n=1 Tax=Planoprotostelium fungivorum TaxID=1890364 RepID=A0A2P6N494_9EUKA|nr:hypothetical protein PROFUN_00952 [Planoprotostelium fungivorum]
MPQMSQISNNNILFALPTLSVGSALLIYFWEKKNLNYLKEKLDNTSQSPEELEKFNSKWHRRHLYSLFFFVPGVLSFSLTISPRIGGALGLTYSVLRLYAASALYQGHEDEKKVARAASAFINVLLLAGGAAGTLVAVVRGQGKDLLKSATKFYINRQIKTVKRFVKTVQRVTRFVLRPIMGKRDSSDDESSTLKGRLLMRRLKTMNSGMKKSSEE